MKRIAYTLTAAIRYDRPVDRQYFSLHITPRSSNAQQVCGIHTKILPTEGYCIQHDFCGNALCVGSAYGQHTEFTYETSGIVFSNYEKGECSAPKRIYALQSPLTALTKEMETFYQQTVSVCLNYCEQSICKQAACLMQVLFYHKKKKKNEAEILCSAEKAFRKRTGSAQDYVHLFLSCLRRAGISARFVTGFCCAEPENGEKETAFLHHWAEVYDGTRWIGLDPVFNRQADDRYVVLAVGRDLSDCMMLRIAGVEHAKAFQEISLTTAESA